jgi:hypothetical protein
MKNKYDLYLIITGYDSISKCFICSDPYYSNGYQTLTEEEYYSGVLEVIIYVITSPIKVTKNNLNSVLLSLL